MKSRRIRISRKIKGIKLRTNRRRSMRRKMKEKKKRTTWRREAV
jgi:hypothetical protein